MGVLRFYYCEHCGAMSMKNFKELDEFCLVCKIGRKVHEVEVTAVTEVGTELYIVDLPAPHTKEK